jgi:hypothetical protein
VASLGDALESGSDEAIVHGTKLLLTARHNNGRIRDKILGLDNAIGKAGSEIWRNSL